MKFNQIIIYRLLLLLLIFLMANAYIHAQSQSGKLLEGRVISATDGQSIQGATISVGERYTITDDKGQFSIRAADNRGTLKVHHMGYEAQTIPYNAETDYIRISLKIAESEIEEVEVINTGYQQLPKERATGSFVQIDNEMLNRRISTNIIERLDGMVAGVVTNTKDRQRGQADIEVRGKSTLYSNAEPLIVLDDFPYEGSLESINPNDIESITFLKDAAAASIWGVRASNGVIVITSKAGKKEAKLKIEFLSNQSFSGKRNVFDQPMLSSSEYIGIERFLFDKGKYNATLNRGYQPVSPVVEILSQMRSGELSEQEGEALLNKVGSYDAKQQYNKYFNQGQYNQQYNTSARGSTESHDYFISAGLDKNRAHTIGSSFERWTLQAANTFRFLNNRIRLSHRVVYNNKADISKNFNLPTQPRYPYSQYIDDTGNHLPDVRTLRLSYVDALTDDRLLDWHDRPLDNLYNSDYHSFRRTTSLRNTLQLEAEIVRGVKASAYYLYEEGYYDNPTYYGVETYYTRNLINQFSYLDGQGNFEYGIPYGAILDVDKRKDRNQTGRFQLNYDTMFGSDHELTAIMGAEIRESTSLSEAYGLYGYDEENKTNQNNQVNYLEPFRMWHSGQSSRISTLSGQSSMLDRFISYYGNFLYAFKDRYRLSFSVRRDGSNLFGVDSNQKFVPLWSVGGLWDIHKEDFFTKDILSRLQLRVSYGYNGNLNKTVSAYLTARRGTSGAMYGQPHFEIVNPPNPALIWERVKNINIGVDMAVKNNRFTASIEYWHKKALDLIADKPTPRQTGISGFTGNSASTLSQGVDITFNSINIDRKLKWSNQLIISSSKNRVLDYYILPASNFTILSNIYSYPQIDYSQFAVFAFPMKGLDDQGDPIGYLEGEESKLYLNIKNSQNLNEMSFIGSSVPTLNGTLWNTVKYADFSLLFSLRYYGGHYFRRNSLDNNAIYNNSYAIWDYDKRWQEAGDENSTNVPSLTYPVNNNRNDFYKYSDLLIEKGDHIRLQDIQLSYNSKKLAHKLSLNSLSLVAGATDIGVVWTKNDHKIDPRYINGNRIRTTYSLGLHINL